MALIRARDWIIKTFAIGSQPSAITIRKWIVMGEINGQIINGNCFVEDSAPFKAPSESRPTAPIKAPPTKVSVLDELRAAGLLKP